MSIHLFSTGAVSLSKAHKETGDVGARLKDKIVITGDIKARLNGDHGHWSDLFHLDCFALTRLFVVPFCRGNPVGSSRSFLVSIHSNRLVSYNAGENFYLCLILGLREFSS
ncbi:uncharacterized protein LOC143027043 [Oratosquilla oratoria]|uniref:uncharacterized protein LOC143027043 n=1 Tax=Oratosquilla oratoria TaxID=337810 RepID=UPI003F764919